MQHFVKFVDNTEDFKGTVSRDCSKTAYIINLQITSLFMDKKDSSSFCKLAEIFAFFKWIRTVRDSTECKLGTVPDSIEWNWWLSGIALS